MKVLIEQSGYDLLNLGDLAMLQFTIEQVQKRWPTSEITVMTARKESLNKLFPAVKPALTSGRNPLTTRDWLFGRVTPKVIGLDRYMRRSMPKTAERLMLLKAQLRKRNLPEITTFRNAVIGSNCVIASGGGYITDSFPEMVEGVCGTLSMAQSRNIPTAMIGQGLGPLEDERLIAFAQEVLPKVDILGLREPFLSPKVALQLGVPADRTTVTGDNATILVFQQRTKEQGDAIGINVRVASYSKVADEEIEDLRKEVALIGKAIPVPMIPLLISQHEHDDQQSAALCPPEHEVLRIPMNAPIDTIKAAGQCRIVITGSYHGAVFALGQGIPVIGLAKSDYYVAKFQGLKELYPAAVNIFNMGDKNRTTKLSDVAIDLYERAPSLRNDILTKSEQIVNNSERVCNDFFDIVSSR